MAWLRPEIISGVTRGTKEFFDKILDGVGMALSDVETVSLEQSEGRLSDASLNSTYAPARLTSLMQVLDQPRSTGSLAPDSPTVTFGSAVSVTPAIRYAHDSGLLRMIGWVPKAESNYLVNASAGSTSEDGGYGVEFDFYGTEFEVTFQQLAASARVHIFIDDRPISAAPQTPTTSTGTTYMKVAFSAAGMRRVKILARKMGFYNVRVPTGAAITATPAKRARIAVIGASFSWGYAGAYDQLTSWPWRLAQLTDTEVLQSAISGTGYTILNRYDAAVRVAAVAGWTPDLIIVEGSGNDEAASEADLQSAAASLYSKLATALPGVPVVVVGPMPRDHTQTLTATRAKLLRAVKAAADTAPNVVGFIDPVGAVDSMAAYATGATYAAGARVTYQGAVYRARVAVASAPATLATSDWELLSWFTGTGKAGATVGDGNRDALLYSDGSHPTEAGQAYLATCILRELRSILAAA